MGTRTTVVLDHPEHAMRRLVVDDTSAIETYRAYCVTDEVEEDLLSCELAMISTVVQVVDQLAHIAYEQGAHGCW